MFISDEPTQLMDLRLDYAFKLFFAVDDPLRLVSLLNGIFANKGIPRVITSLIIENPSLERRMGDDKLSTLDVLAQLSDGSEVCIEMHLYDFEELKYKSLRSWARVYAENLKSGQEYMSQKPVICVSFINDSISDADGRPVDRIHSVFHVMERDSRQVLLPNLEMHYIDMKAFASMLNVAGCGGGAAGRDKFTKWLAIITQKDITDPAILQDVYAEEEFRMAREALTRLSQDRVYWLSYQNRLDELAIIERAIEKAENRADEAEQRADEAEQHVEEEKQRADDAERRADEEKRSAEEAKRSAEEAGRRAEEEKRSADEQKLVVAALLKLFADGSHSRADIAKALNISEQEVEAMLKPGE
jgi:predicted transposase/invertase (TIGR01784 family)